MMQLEYGTNFTKNNACIFQRKKISTKIKQKTKTIKLITNYNNFSCCIILLKRNAKQINCFY